MRECSPPQTCHMSRVTCHMSHFFISIFSLLFFGQSGEAYRWRVCYQRGLPRLVLMVTEHHWAGVKIGRNKKLGLVEPIEPAFDTSADWKIKRQKKERRRKEKLTSNRREGAARSLGRGERVQLGWLKS